MLDGFMKKENRLFIRGKNGGSKEQVGRTKNVETILFIGVAS